MEKLKSPAINFYTSDFMTGTIFMSNEEVGAYIRLLCMQHQKGHLNEKEMVKICNTYEILDSVMTHFKKDEDGLFYNERMDFEKERREKYKESRAKNRSNPNKDMKHISNTYEKHMENIIINILNNNKNISKEYILEYYSNNINNNISSFEYQKLEYYIELFKNDLRIIIYAIEYCKLYKALNINYLSKILYNWKEAGFKTLEDVKNAEREKPQVEESTKENEELFDYDWLNDNDD